MKQLMLNALPRRGLHGTFEIINEIPSRFFGNQPDLCLIVIAPKKCLRFSRLTRIR